jgi:hypothetical protein
MGSAVTGSLSLTFLFNCPVAVGHSGSRSISFAPSILFHAHHLPRLLCNNPTRKAVCFWLRRDRWWTWRVLPPRPVFPYVDRITIMCCTVDAGLEPAYLPFPGAHLRGARFPLGLSSTVRLADYCSSPSLKVQYACHAVCQRRVRSC